MNTVTPVNNEIPLPPRFGLVPTNMSEAMKLAEMMASARLVPKDLQKSPADCLMVIQQAIRWDMDPFAVAQECSVIQGKLMHSGKLVAAVVNARGNLTERLSFAYRGEGENRTITVSGHLRGEAQPRTVEVILKNARTSNAMWTKQPDQQLMYHGTRVWARRHTPELMLGVYSPEEFEEQTKRPRAAPNVMIPHDPETGEIIEPPEEENPQALNQGSMPGEAPAVSESPQPPAAGATSLDEILEEYDRGLAFAAQSGTVELKAEWDIIPKKYKKELEQRKNEVHKPAAEKVDQKRGI